MAQTNYTPISLYYSTTASAVPTAANLVPGELAINTNDGKLYYEDSSGVVQVLATKSTGSIGGSNTQVQFNNSGSLGGSSGLTWDGSFLTTSSIKNSALTSGRVTYAGASGLLSDSANLVWDNTNARLGVGVSPSYPLSVQTSTTANNRVTGNFYNTGATGTNPFDNWLLRIASNGSGADCSINFTDSVTWNAYIGMNSGKLNFAPNSGTTAMTINTSGYVGIGTTSPSWPLDVQKSSDGIVGYFRRINATINPALYITANETGNTVGFGTDYAGATSPAMTFTTGGTERMRIDSSGSLLVGTANAPTTGGFPRSVVLFKQLNDTSAYSGIQLEANGNTNVLGIGYNGSTFNFAQSYRTTGGFIPISFSTSNAEAMRIDTSGNLLVGTTVTNPISSRSNGLSTLNKGFNIRTGTNAIAFGLDATSGNNIYFYTDNGSAAVAAGFISSSGSTTLYNATSDQRLKTNIVDAPIGNIDDIKVRSFDWITDGTHQKYGMVAQELLEVAPYAVSKSENPDEMMGVDYSKLVPMMIKEIQDLKQRIETLENK